MAYAITQNKFAPKCAEYKNTNTENSHSIAFDKCNFRCAFCGLTRKRRTNLKNYSAEEFEEKVKQLIKQGRSFKFTGGEPTLNPDLARDLKIAKKYGGKIYLDTNASNPEKIKALANDGLIDVIGISLKGLSADEAVKTAGIANKKLCWDNVFETIDFLAEQPNIRTIITYVLTKPEETEQTLEKFAELLKPYPHVYIKINNLFPNDVASENGLSPLKEDCYFAELKKFVSRHPEYKGRIILIPSMDAMTNYSAIEFY